MVPPTAACVARAERRGLSFGHPVVRVKLRSSCRGRQCRFGAESGGSRSECITKVKTGFFDLHISRVPDEGRPLPRRPGQIPRRMALPLPRVRNQTVSWFQSASRAKRVRGRKTRGRGSHTQAQCRTRARVRFKRGTLGTRSSEVVVENSLALASTRGPSGRDDLSKSRRDLLAASQSTRSRAGQGASPARDEEIRAADQDGAAQQRGSDREGSSPTH